MGDRVQVEGSSPRTWGKVRQHSLILQIPGIIPTHVGKSIAESLISPIAFDEISTPGPNSSTEMTAEGMQTTPSLYDAVKALSSQFILHRSR